MTLSDEFAKLFVQPSPELLARLASLDALDVNLDAHLAAMAARLDGRIDGLTARMEGFATAIANLTATVDGDFAEDARRITALMARVAKLEPTPPPDPFANDTVHVGPATKVSTLNIGWAPVQETDLGAGTKAILDKCATAKKIHMLAFGPDRPIQAFEGGPIDFSYHDKIFGYPNRSDGYFGDKCIRVLTAYGCPPYMRQPRTPGLAPNPTGAPDMTLYGQSPPHWSQHDNHAILLAAFVDRYQIDVLEDRNEWKGENIGGLLPTGAAIVPPGSGLPLAPGSLANRWAMELHTDRWNKMWTHVKAVRPECQMAMGYMVTRTYQSATNADSANGVFPMLLKGAWGFADKKAMQAMMYMVEHALGFDYICLDTKTSVNDALPGQGISPENQWSGLQKVLDWEQWFNDLADWNPAKYGRAKDKPTWYAEAYSRVPGGLTATNHQEAVATDAWEITNYIFKSRAVGWMRWQTEGDRKAGVDPASAHSIALHYAKGSPKSLQETEAAPMYAGLVKNFPPGTQLYSVTVDDDAVTGIASDSTVCLVSRSAIQSDLTFKGEPLVLAPYDVKFVPR